MKRAGRRGWFVASLLALLLMIPSCGRQSPPAPEAGPQTQPPASAEGYPPYPDEAAAMAVYSAEPNETNLHKLVAIRVSHAMDLANAFQTEGDIEAYRRALSYAEEAANMAPGNARVLFTAGWLYSWAADTSENVAAAAIGYLQAALELDPELDEAQAQLGAIYYDLHEYDRAIGLWENLVQAGGAGSLETIFDSLCEAYQLDGQLHRGDLFFSDLLLANPESDSLRIALALIRKAENQDAEARALLREVIESEVSSLQNRHRANVYLKQWDAGEGRS